MTIAPSVELDLQEKDIPVTQPDRRIRFLGDGYHGAKQVQTSSEMYEVEEEPLDLIRSYRIAYMFGMYADPEAMRAADVTSLDAPECPCNSTF
jgi:hypothetical protein